MISNKYERYDRNIECDAITPFKFDEVQKDYENALTEVKHKVT